MKRNIKILVLATAFLLSGLSFAKGGEVDNRNKGSHILSFGYSPVLRSWWYDIWKPVPPLKFSLNYA
ncbi:MAG: hypothetical protein K2I66_00780, partial [Bacteroidales bacterium]|nr:hypothetical protein [Bacteroidales bacterium]